MRRHIHEILGGIGYWMSGRGSAYSRTALWSRYQDLIGIVAKHANVTPAEAARLLQNGYLEKWILRRINNDD